MTEEKKGFTLWEHFTHKDKSPPTQEKLEDTISNPLKLHIGDFIIPKMLAPKEGIDHRVFEVDEIVEYDKLIGRQHFYITDYLLKEKDDTYILRTNLSDQKVYLAWLEIYFESVFNEDILDAAKHKVFHIDEESKEHIDFESLNSDTEGFLCEQKVVSKGKDYIQREEVRYWDFSREVADGAETELFFVEINKSTGYIMMFRGNPISEYDIEIIPK